MKAAIAWCVIGVLIVVMFIANGIQQEACDKRGGMLLRGATGMECVRAEVLDITHP